MSELKTRDQVATEFKWNLTTMFADDAAWQARYDALVASYEKDIKQYEGKMADNAENLLGALRAYDKIGEEMGKIYLYTMLKSDEDTGNSTYTGMADKARGLYVGIGAASSFFRPEIIAMGEEKAKAYMSDNADLQIYAHFFDDMFRQQAHVLTPDKEEIMARASEIGGAASNIYGKLTNTDMVFGKAKDSNGVEHEVTTGTFVSLQESKDRVLRKNVYETYYQGYIGHKNTLAEAYNYSVKNDNFVATVRNYDNAMAAALHEDNIPTEIYHNLVNTVNDNLHLMHRYMELRKKCLKVDELHFYDVYTPIVEDADTKVSWEDAKRIVIEGTKALGADYQALVKRCFDERWVDVYPNKNKRSGAYCAGVHGIKHPFMLMNYDDTINNMFTLTHEAGHVMHSYFSHEEQPYVYGNYTIFLAEIASTVNEALLMDYMLSITPPTDKAKYNYLLNYFMEQFKSTFFRQTMFAEFEMLAHEMADKNIPLTVDSLRDLYKELLTKHFGPHMNVDDTIIYEWSRIPHYYRAYYVYQYATGFTAAMALSKKIREEGQPAVDKYLKMLRSGSNDYSINLLKEAGVDMTTAEPFKQSLSIFEDLMDRFEKANF
ncbi:MAG: oligoendopeptidase F [Defluviitaleaceae bacterium]|nr:oligoendopeptidase F [Defluviitaleaceae bacterium]